VACAYIDHHLQSDENEADVILQDVFSVNPVLIWSFQDALNPKVSIANLKECRFLDILMNTQQERK